MRQITQNKFLLSILFLFVEYFIISALFTALRNKNNTTKKIIVTFYCIISIVHYVLLFNLSAPFMVEWHGLGKALTIAFIMGLTVGKTLTALISLLSRFINVIQWLLKYKKGDSEYVSTSPFSMNRGSFLAKFALIIGGLMTGTFLVGVKNRYNYRIHRIKVPIPNLPDELIGVTLAQISDIHAGSFSEEDRDKLQEGIDLINGLNADIICFTGDLVNNEATEIVPYKSIFSQLSAPLGVYSTLGNHDYGDYKEWPSEKAKEQNLATLIQHHKDMGWDILMNEHRVFDINGKKIALLGVENWGSKARFPKKGRMDLAVKDLESDIDLQILLSHDPSHWDAVVRTEYSNVDIMLSGHTHGMQFGIELPFMKWSPIKYIYKQWAGLYQIGNQFLYVNRGFGFLGYQGRVGILPEITLLEFTKG